MRKKILPITLAVVVGVFSLFGVSGCASSTDFHHKTLNSLQEKQNTVMALSAASATASVAVAMIPGDASTPIANTLADLSSHFILALCAIFLEKYLLTTIGSVTFSILIPLACLLFILYHILGHKILKELSVKIGIWGIALFLVVPASTFVSDKIYDTYKTSIDSTIETAAEIEVSAENQETEEGFWSGLFSTVTNGVSKIADKAKEWINGLIEGTAVMLVTCCVIPVLALVAFAWFTKVLLNMELPINYTGIHGGLKNRFFPKKQSDAIDA